MQIEKIVSALTDFYNWVQSLQVSSGFLLGLAALFAIAGMLALREAAAWFFKVEDLKKDIARLQDTAALLESEIRLVQTLMREATDRQSNANQNLNPATTTPVAAGPVALNKTEAETSPTPQFPINH
jgi:hypothetical protein